MMLMDLLFLHEAWQMLYNNNQIIYHPNHGLGGL